MEHETKEYLPLFGSRPPTGIDLCSQRPGSGFQDYLPGLARRCAGWLWRPQHVGDGTVSVNAGKAQICYNLRVFVYPGDGSNWPPASIGIYRAPAGSNGPLVVDLHPDFSSGPNASGCVGVSSTLAHEIQRNPSRYYILVTSIKHPEGAVRAQLVK